jgi:integrase
VSRISDYVIEYHGRKVNSIKTGFRRACKEAGIEDCSPHVLRHTSASHMVMASVPLAEIARTLGDSEAMIEKVYGHHSPDYQKRATDALVGETATLTQKPRQRPTKNKQNRHTDR